MDIYIKHNGIISMGLYYSPTNYGAFLNKDEELCQLLEYHADVLTDINKFDDIVIIALKTDKQGIKRKYKYHISKGCEFALLGALYSHLQEMFILGYDDIDDIDDY